MARRAPPAKKLPVLFLHGDCCTALRALLTLGVRVHSIVMDPAYESLERHRARGTTPRLTKWFSTFANARYWELFPLLYKVLLGDAYLHAWADVETADVILHGRCVYHRPSHKALQEVVAAHDGLCCFEHSEQNWTVWPRFPWLKTKATYEVDPMFAEVEIDYAHAQTGMGYHWRRCHEEILIFAKGCRALNNAALPGLLLGARARKGDYPTAKPVEAYERIILNTTEPEDIVLDPFAGSGNCAIAAVKHGRRCILIDTEHSGVHTTLAKAGLLNDTLYARYPVGAATPDLDTLNRLATAIGA